MQYISTLDESNRKPLTACLGSNCTFPLFKAGWQVYITCFVINKTLFFSLEHCRSLKESPLQKVLTESCRCLSRHYCIYGRRIILKYQPQFEQKKLMMAN